MEFPAAPTHRGLVPWLGLLLAVFLLAFWILPTTAQFAIVSTNAAEGQDVILRTLNKPSNVARFMWYRGERTNSKNLIMYVTHLRRYRTGSAYSGREAANLKGHLIIKNVTLKDTGMYMVVAILRNLKIEASFGHLNVYQRVKVPTLLPSITTATEKKDAVVITCEMRAPPTVQLKAKG
ncbi:Carcinoembryonic antigen-related cell adhesion molecule 6 [Myotis davidii]|uniref:Carcinoembryonic antigen-related cell adhesion molecule 6 n=1 Tax=Myotis davidii TaxID=225400 RepID=L5LGZ6_MYODS|nr:Carcinoembryonic antigen-related cell adhesion molecule 6 [Myotis davidii]